MTTKDLVERYEKGLRFFNGNEDDYHNVLLMLCNDAMKIGIDSNIRFFARRNRRKVLKKKMDENQESKRLTEEIDDLSAKNAKFWKELDAKYRYFYPHIK
jgi:predicted AAA+ superfamily ATPase